VERHGAASMLGVIYFAASNASGANAVTFSIDVSYDGGSTWCSDFNEASQVVNLTTTVKTGEVRNSVHDQSY